MDNKELLNKLILFEKYYLGSKYEKKVKLAIMYYDMGKLNLCEKELASLPGQAELLEALVLKLKGKSVYRTLKQIQEGRVENNLVTLKGLSSLLTHIVIECEHGATEYKILIPLIVEKISEISYDAC